MSEDDARGEGVASFVLPPSPCRSPKRSDNMSVWVEDAGGEQRVHVALHSDHLRLDAAAGASATSAGPEPGLSPLKTTLPSPTVESPSSGVVDFPLILCESRGGGPISPSGVSSAIVPFQKLQLDTNLNQTLLPYRSSSESPEARSTSSAGASSDADSPSAASARKKAHLLASNFLSMDPEASAASMMSPALMNAIGMQPSPPEQPQLSVRLRGSRIELASASEEEEIDFLGPAENIKQLFKLPYSSSGVSLAVHRVGSTLVVDGELAQGELPAGFDDEPTDAIKIEQNSLVASEVATQQQALLYEKFIYESARLPVSSTDTLSPATESALEPRQQSDAQNQQPSKSTRSKKREKKAKKKAVAAAAAASADRAGGSSVPLTLEEPLGQSLITSPRAELDANASNIDPRINASVFHSSPKGEFNCPAAEVGKTPGAMPSFELPDRTSFFSAASRGSPTSFDIPTFQRVLKWKFHDLKMILGSQVLLFSNQDHPAVSLRLHDMDQELSLCSVLDYYLDNVIANIPELAICMHSNGLVRGYKLVETRNIPYMSDTGRPLFDVQDVSMNASMLLKFLQENCSRPNGTYWLHRKEGESSLRLYDVNVLSQGKQLKWKYMMAMLCYRFAARASRLVNSLANGSPRLQQQLRQRQRDLLRTCMNLLREIAQSGGTAHSSICASVSEQLADTYIREREQMHEESSGSGNGQGDSTTEKDSALESLQHAKEHLLDSILLFQETIPPPRSASALVHQENDAGGDGEETNDAERTDVTDASGSTEGSETGDDDDDFMLFMDEELTRLKLKFSSVCLEQSSVHFENQNWSDAVKAMGEACKYLTASAIPDDVQSSADMGGDGIDKLIAELDFDGVEGRVPTPDRVVMCSSGSDLRSFLLERIGDMASQVPVAIASQLTQLYRVVSGEERDSLARVKGDNSATEWMQEAEHNSKSILGIFGTGDEIEHLLMLAFLSYLRSMAPSVDSELYFVLMKKLGNASNELGKYALGRQQNYEAAFRWFERGARIFSDIEDSVNVALLYANMSHLHKILARGKDRASREKHYRTAIQLCSDALQRLKQTKAELELRDKVKGELALTYLVWAVDISADQAPAGHTGRKNDAALDAPARAVDKARENEVLKIFDKALILYNELSDAKQVASTHYQVASFYNRSIARELQTEYAAASSADRSDATSTSSTLKNRMEIARRHYEKALDYFGKAEVGQTFVLIHQELADLYAMGGRVEDMEHALLFLLNTYEAFNLAFARESSTGDEAMGSLARDVIAKVKLLLHQLIRRNAAVSTQTVNGSSHTKVKKLDMFKKMYKEVIYYDGYSANGSVVPLMGTLRAMYLL